MTGGEGEQSMARARLGEEERRDCTLGMRVTAAEAEALRFLLTDALQAKLSCPTGTSSGQPTNEEKDTTPFIAHSLAFPQGFLRVV